MHMHIFLFQEGYFLQEGYISLRIYMCILFLFDSYICGYMDFSQLRICRLPPPLPSLSLCRIEVFRRLQFIGGLYIFTYIYVFTYILQEGYMSLRIYMFLHIFYRRAIYLYVHICICIYLQVGYISLRIYIYVFTYIFFV